jgi:hypothetical protein
MIWGIPCHGVLMSAPTQREKIRNLEQEIFEDPQRLCNRPESRCQPSLLPAFESGCQATADSSVSKHVKWVLQEFKGYIFKISGGQDKQGFPMKQGVLTNGRVFLLMKPGDTCFRGFGRRNVRSPPSWPPANP